MIQANELRIGNWVIDPDGNPVTVNDIFYSGQEGINACDNNYECYPILDFDELSPIPLTPEILEKAGFEKDKLGYTNGFNFSLYYNHKKDKGNYGAYWKSFEAGVDFKHLHQLQNLYFALTGMELNINF